MADTPELTITSLNRATIDILERDGWTTGVPVNAQGQRCLVGARDTAMDEVFHTTWRGKSDFLDQWRDAFVAAGTDLGHEMIPEHSRVLSTISFNDRQTEVGPVIEVLEAMCDAEAAADPIDP